MYINMSNKVYKTASSCTITVEIKNTDNSKIILRTAELQMPGERGDGTFLYGTEAVDYANACSDSKDGLPRVFKRSVPHNFKLDVSLYACDPSEPLFSEQHIAAPMTRMVMVVPDETSTPVVSAYTEEALLRDYDNVLNDPRKIYFFVNIPE